MEKSTVNGDVIFAMDQHGAELTEPKVGAFDLLTPFVGPHFPTILLSALFVVLPVGRDQLEASPFPSFQRRIGAVAAAGDHPLGLLPRPTFGSRNTELPAAGMYGFGVFIFFSRLGRCLYRVRQQTRPSPEAQLFAQPRYLFYSGSASHIHLRQSLSAATDHNEIWN